MSTRSKKGNNFNAFESYMSNARHYRITINMRESKAWKDLDIYARDLYHYMKSKYNFNNENNISCTYEEGMELMSKASFTKAMDSLISHGFIKIIRNGRNLRQPNIYGFSDLWKQYPNVDITPRLKRSKQDTEKNLNPKRKKEISARSNITHDCRSDLT
jgi:hypothetical protein